MIIRLFAAVCLLAVISCGKTSISSKPRVGGASGLLKSLTQVVTSGNQNDSIVTTFTYDSQNRVITQITVSHSGGSISGSNTTTYSYFADSVIQNTTGLTIVTYYLNSNGYRASDNSGDKWTYNVNGYLMSAALANSASTYTYNASNQLATQTNVTSVATTTDTYTYPANPIGSGGSSWQIGKSTGALWTTDIQVKNGVTTTFTYTYSTDSKNRLSEETTVSSAASSSQVVTYYAYY